MLMIKSLPLGIPRAEKLGSCLHPQKLADRLKDCIRAKGKEGKQRVFPISYIAARVMVRKAGTSNGGYW
jgi:hypothetical protein